MRRSEELVPHDELPKTVKNVGQTCEQGAPEPCGAPADVSIWTDFGVTRHRWTDWRWLCREHFASWDLEHCQWAFPLTEYAKETLGLDGPPSDEKTTRR